MPMLSVGDSRREFPEGTRLVRAIEALGVDIGHRCGGQARCTTCRVEFDAGEPDVMTRAEADKLAEKGLSGQARLSCQIVLTHDMTVRPLMTLRSEGWSDAGPEPAEEVTPEPSWIPASDGASTAE
ncbi:MAG: 2Fe-2S iron-sulfur cluster-binding protein [Trueperaceae bacterium]|nr:2Fe-2S iron-sulfur cluster-binding protein [Trueperaceae bacterium]